MDAIFPWALELLKSPGSSVDERLDVVVEAGGTELVLAGVDCVGVLVLLEAEDALASLGIGNSPNHSLRKCFRVCLDGDLGHGLKYYGVSEGIR